MINKIIDYIMKEAFVAKWAELYQNQLDNMVNQFAAKNKSKLQQNPNDDFNEIKKPYFEYAKLLNDNVIKKIKVDPKTEKLLIIWLLEQILNGTIEGERLHEDVQLIKDSLEKYFKNRDLIGRNIFTPGITYHNLLDMVEPYRIVSDDKYEGLLDKPVAQGNGYKVYKVTTMDQCIPIGDKGGWCINKTDGANRYLKQGYLYFVTKNDKQFGLLHFPSGQFNYIQNRPMDKEDIIKIRDMWPESEKIAEKNISLKANNIIWIKNPSETLQMAVVKEDGEIIKYIENPSEAVKLAAVKQNYWVIHAIENPSEAVQLAAVKQNRGAIKYIKNPTKRVKQYVKEQYGK